MPPRSISDPRLLAKAGALYYLRGQTQQQIADRLRVSRPSVSRMLEEARRQGIVQITIAPVGGTAGDLEAELETRFGIREAVVTAAAPDGADPVQHIGAAAAGYLQRTASSGATLGLTWGTTLGEMVRALVPAPLRGATVVQMLGGIGPAQAEAHAADLTRRLARLLEADLQLIQAPGIVATEAVRDALLGDPQIHDAVEAIRGVDVAFVGIGALSTNPVLEPGAGAGVVPEGLREALAEAGAVGDVALRFFDADGGAVPCPLDERLIGVDLDTLHALPHVVGVAGGPAKADAIRAVLRAKLLDVLITDAETAALLLA